VYTRLSAFTAFLHAAGVAVDGPPTAPTLRSVRSLDRGLSVRVDPPADEGGQVVRYYEVTARDVANGRQYACRAEAVAAPAVAGCALTGLVNGHAYWVSAQAFNDLGPSDVSSERRATPAGAPGTPTLRRWTPVGPGAVAFAVRIPPSHGAALLRLRVVCSAASGPTRSARVGSGGRATVAGLRPRSPYRCVGVATNRIGTTTSAAVRVRVPA
jgi:hypothetical protein